MKNVKLTLATTLSVLALTFAGTASADGDGYGHFYKEHFQKNRVTKMIVAKDTNKHSYKANRKTIHKNKRVVKRVVVKNTPTKKVIISKTIINKPVKSWRAKNKRFQHIKRFNKQYRKYQKRQNRFHAKRAVTKTVYRVRPGDTLIQISYKTGVSIKRLARLNRFKNGNLNNLRIGQKLRLV